MQIEMTKTKYQLKAGTKTAFNEVETETKEITRKQYDNIVNSCSFFRRLGGSETVTKNYTSRGYIPVKIVSKNPDRTIKVVRTFKFDGRND